MVREVLDDFLATAQERRARPHAAGRSRRRRRLGEIRIGLGFLLRGPGQRPGARGDRPRCWPRPGAAAVVKRVGCVGMCHQTPLVEMVPPGGPVDARTPRSARGRARRSCCEHFQAARASSRRLGYSVSRLARPAADRRDERAGRSRHAIDVRERPGLRVPRPAEAPGHRVLRPDRPARPRRVPAPRRLRGPAAVPDGADRPKRSSSEIRDQRPARPRRGRLSHARQVGRWSATPTGDTKYIICNGDEGDPGAFMDRMLLESFPYRVIEGMAIAARAVGADEGVLLHPRRVPAGGAADPRGARALPASAGCLGDIGAGQRLPACSCRSRKGPGRSSAARRRR